MTLLRTIEEMELLGIYDSGIPNQERITYRTHASLNLGEYILCLGAQQPDGSVAPIQNTLLWLGDERLDQDSFLFVYTGRGQRRSTVAGGRPALVLHWQSPQTMFNLPGVVPVTFHISGILAPAFNSRADAMVTESLRRQLATTAPPQAPPTLSNNDSLSPGWLSDRLVQLGFDQLEVRRDLGQCVLNLQRRGISTRTDAERFFTDKAVWQALRTLYHEELHREDGRLDPSGFTWWGPLLHHASPAQRTQAMSMLRNHFRQIYAKGAR
ncbi:hypothetical protein K2Z84_12185 [Candidatus Binatia bacterium]|nr:hypothetical protein [Candidatus Binatia bacterium]